MNYSRLLAAALISNICAMPVWAAEKINVVASFSILGDLVQQVGAEHVSVSTLVGPNGDAHVYQPTPQDTVRLTKSRLFVVNGLGFEGWMERLVSASHYKGTVITASQGIKPQTFTDADDAAHPHVTQDPHAWHNIPNAEQYVHNIADGLSQIDPEHKAEYQANAANYIQQLEQLDKTLLQEFAAIPADQRKMITSHDAFGYLSARYQITTIAPQEKIKALFVENISDPRLMQQISKETGVNPGKELFSDALSDKSGPASTYLDMMHYNTTQILSALKQ
jgi:zinc/manganese transport system substrate-binding protein